MQSNHVNPLIGAQFQSHINIFHLIMRSKEDWQLEMRFKTASILNRKKPMATLKDPKDLPFLAWVCYLIQDCLNTMHSNVSDKIVR